MKAGLLPLVLYSILE